MAGLDQLPPDQRAVLQLVLRQGRSYADLAGLLKITPDAVRARAHAGMAALAGDGLPPERRALLSDYLLGQLDDGERIAAYAELTESAPDQQWARAAAAELAPLAGDALPEVPSSAPASAATAPPPAPEPVVSQPVSEPPLPDRAPGGATPAATPDPVPAKPAAGEPSGRRRGGEDPAPSRLGGLALLAGVTILAAAVVLALVVNGGDDGGSTTTTPVGTTSTAASGGTRTNSTSTTPGRVVAQVNLNAPSGAGSPVGVVQLRRAGNSAAFIVQLQGLQKPSSGFVSIWLTGANTKPLELVAIDRSKISARLTTFAPVPRDMAPYDTMLVTQQPGSPKRASKAPGTTLLSGAVNVKS